MNRSENAFEIRESMRGRGFNFIRVESFLEMCVRRLFSVARNFPASFIDRQAPARRS